MIQTRSLPVARAAPRSLRIQSQTSILARQSLAGLHRRSASTSTSKGAINSRSLSYLALFTFGAAASYASYLLYQSWTVWPAPLRNLLRPALRAQKQGDLPQAEHLFRQALQVASQPDMLAQLDPFKISGIAIALGGVLEQQQRLTDALQVYDDAFKQASKSLNTSKRDQQLMMRAVALAQKVGRMAAELPAEAGYEQLAEKRMSWAVSRMLKAVADRRQEMSEVERNGGLDLPEFITYTDLGASMEDLGLFYLAKGNKDYATPLLFRALTLILPGNKPPGSPDAPTLEDRCHGATIANNLASAFALHPAEPDQATHWADNALYIANVAMRESGFPADDERLAECRSCRAVAHFNKASAFELDGNVRLAKQDFKKSLDAAREDKFVPGAKEALNALERIEQR